MIQLWHVRKSCKPKRLLKNCSPNSVSFCALYKDEIKGRLCLGAKSAVVTVSVLSRLRD